MAVRRVPESYDRPATDEGERGLDNFEGRSWQRLHRDALMTIICLCLASPAHDPSSGRKKEAIANRLNRACLP